MGILAKKSDFTLYVNPYLVAQNGGRYTKHIYIGSQRIVSKLGDFDSYGADPRRVEKAGESFSGVKVNYDAKYKKALEVLKENYTTLDVPYYGTDNNDYGNGLGFCCNPAGDTNSGSTTGKMTAKNDNAELQQFYYHPDHLGSSSYISNLDGEVVQHIEYVPFGEVFLEEKNAKWNTPYLFTSKELDRETGLYYFGARYQDPKLGIFISVDPLAAMTANYSSYAYVHNNPVNLIDPTGMSAEDIEPNRKATEGEIYHDSSDNTTYQGNKNGTWTQATELSEVYISQKAKGFYKNFFQTNGSNAYALSTGYNHNSKYFGVDSNVSVLRAEWAHNTGTGALPLAVDVSGAVYGAKGSVSGRLGTKEFNLFGGANGSVFSANANVSTGIFTGEGQKYGVLLDANVGAYALKGEYSFGGTLFGISMQSTVGGSLGAAHIGGTAGTYYDAKRGTFNITVKENIGLGIGENAAVEIKIPVPFIKK